jgi:superfamily II DNA or RNA helicase
MLAGAFAWLCHEKILDLPPEHKMRFAGLGHAKLFRDRARALGEAGILRNYQVDAVSAAVGALTGRGIIQAPTGSGKTYIAAGIISCIAGPWLYIVQNRELAAQTQQSFLKVIPQMCVALHSSDKVTMGLPSVRTISYGEVQHLPEDVPVKGIVVDECHGASAKTRANALARAHAQFRFGMSATPLDRQDKKNGLVVGLLGPIIYSISAKTLEDAGSLAKGKVLHLVFDHSKLK